MLITHAEIDGRGPLSVRVDGERIAAVGPDLARSPGEPCVDAAGGALLPGLHDHHIHLLALAAAQSSLRCGPPEVADEEALARALRAAGPRGGWIRGVGYHESVAGALDRERLDRWRGDVPVRIQHRSGARWILNSAALERAGIASESARPGVECDARGRPTGCLTDLDPWLRERLGADAPPDLAPVGRALAAFGVTGVTDASPGNGADEAALFADARAAGALPQRLWLMGSESVPRCPGNDVRRGPLKIMLAERSLPELDALAGRIADAHADQRRIAIHCVTRAELWLACAAFEDAGVHPGDRIEHAAVAPPEAVERLATLGLTVVTQHHFLEERGDIYARDVEACDRPWLYRGRGFQRAGVALGGGTDAPFGGPDPWRAMRAAVRRRSAGGLCFDVAEALEPEAALALFTTPPEDPGGAPRRVAAGAAADLCLLDRPWREARDRLTADDVVWTLRGGVVLHRR